MISEKNTIVEKNRQDWNQSAQSWSEWNHSEKVLRPILEDPSKAFHPAVWAAFQKYFPDFKGKRVCVPSSGDNLAVFAFALLGARVTSCDISENQLANARKIAERENLEDSIEWIQADTMRLDSVADEAYDLVYTSNGVHVWLDNLPAMYGNIYRILKPGGWNIIYEVHPFLRPFDDSLKVIKPYSCTGPFEDETTVNFHWRMQDIVNAVVESGIRLMHIEEMYDQKDDIQPAEVDDLIQGQEFSREAADPMYDWKQNPYLALPQWLCLVGKKP